MALTHGLLSVELSFNKTEDEFLLTHIVAVQVVLDSLKQFLRHLKCHRSHIAHVISFFLLYFRVEFIVHRKGDKLSHCHSFMPFEIFSDFGMEVGIDFYGDAFLFIRHCARSFLYIF